MKYEIMETLYKRVAKPIFFKLDPEDVHDRMLKLGKLMGRTSVTRKLTSSLFASADPVLEQTVLGIKFVNPIGLSAGFDKNAELTSIMPSVGFGFEEVGSITALECAGNARPRLWRHPDLQSLRVYYGLKNDGADVIAERVRSAMRARTEQFPIGISIAKTNCEDTVDVQKGIDDYAYTHKLFREIGDYDTINISCPNAFGGQPFTNPERLERLLSELDRSKGTKPMFIKLSPDLSLSELNELVTVATRHKIDGIISSNLVKKHEFGKGGLSGKVVSERSYEHIKHIRKEFGERFVIIGVGGLFTGDDVYRVLRAGASLVQLITGMIYQGPQTIGKINRDLARLIKADGYNSISEVIGIDV